MHKQIFHKMVTEDEIASWDYAKLWDKFPVPARPSKEELYFLGKEIDGMSPTKILILGSTIEYRDLCKKKLICPYIADFDRQHYKILTKYSKEKFANEHFLEIDWLKIKDSGKYDMIIGHRAFNVIGKKMMNKFFSNMFKALKPGGVFFCKGNIFYKNQKDNLFELVDKWAFRKREYPLFSYIEVCLYFHCADKNGYVDYPKATNLMKILYERKKILKEDYGLIKILISMSSEARFRGKISQKEIRTAIKLSGFSDEWIVLDKTICKNMPIIKLTK